MKKLNTFYILAIIVMIGSVFSIVSSCVPESKCDPELATPFNLTLPFRFPEMNLPTDNPMTEEGVELGRFLFYDTTLSINHQVSCGSCHKPEFGFSDGGKQFSTNSKGMMTKRNTPALLNVGFQNKFFFDGRSGSLEEAVDDAIKNEMEVNWEVTLPYLEKNTFYSANFKKAFGCDAVTKENVLKAISQFMRSIISSGESEIDKKFFTTNDYTQLSPAASRGFLLFTSARADCFHCHFTNILTTDNQFHNDGVQYNDGSFNFGDNGRGAITNVQTDNGKMKTPSLRNLAYTAPYGFDGRFNTLREVVDFYADSVHMSPTLDAVMIHTGNIRLNLTNSERDDLVAFMLSMTDSTVIVNPKFQNPFR